MKIIQNPCNGIGDALVFCWLSATARVHGVQDFIINPVKNQWVFNLFNTPIDDSISNPLPHPPKLSTTHRHWLDSWLDGYLDIQDVSPVAPIAQFMQEELNWAEMQWYNHMPEGPRVLCFPDFMRADRAWPFIHWHALRALLPAVTCTIRPFVTPANIHSIFGRQMAALIASADLVIANDSGPAHFAGTFKVPCIVLHGPTHHDNYYGWYKNMVPIHGSLGCEGCNWKPDIYRSPCATGCSSLYTISPIAVAKIARTLLAGVTHDR